MRDGVVDIEIGQEVLLLGRLSARFGVPRDLREPRRALMVLPRLASMPSAMRRLRSYWADEWSTQAVVNLSDHDVLSVVGGAIETGQLQAAVLPRIVPGQLIETATPVNRARTAPTARIARAVPPTRAVGRSPPSAAPVASPLPGVVTPAHALPVARWPLEQRVAEVIRRTIPKVPGDIGATLLSLLSPESLAIVAGTMVFSAAANLTPYGWAADAVIVGIAFGFGGLAAIHALGDLVECFKWTVGATSEQDLDAAADALARAVVGLGVVAMMVVLHRVAARKGGGGPPSGGGSAGQAGEQAMQREMAAARAERLKARLEAHQENARAAQAKGGEPPPEIKTPEPGSDPSKPPSKPLYEQGDKPPPGTRDLTADQFKEIDRYHRAKSRSESYSGHGHGRHGSQTTIAEQTRRVQTGEAPDGNLAKTDKATKFDSHAKEVEAVERAKAKNPGAGKPLYTPSGKPNRDVKVVDDGPEGYGSGVEVQEDANGDPLPGRPVQPTGQQPNAKVVFQYNPKTGNWDPYTQFPTDDPVTP
jgi:hypothetical protein